MAPTATAAADVKGCCCCLSFSRTCKAGVYFDFQILGIELKWLMVGEELCPRVFVSRILMENFCHIMQGAVFYFILIEHFEYLLILFPFVCFMLEFSRK